MTLDWTAISTISELVGAAAVVVTLGYVAVQIRQGTHAILVNSRQTLLDADLALISAFITHAIDPHLIGDEVKLTPEDDAVHLDCWSKQFESGSSPHQYTAGNLDEKSWQSI